MRNFVLLILIFPTFYEAKAQDFDDSVAIYQQLEKIDKSLKVDSLESHKLLKISLKKSQKLNYTLGQAKSLELIGKYYFFWHKDGERAAEMYMNALSLYEGLGMRDKSLELTLELSFLFNTLGYNEKAFNFFTESLKKNKNDTVYGCILNNALGGMMKAINEDEKAIGYYDKSSNLFEEIAKPDSILWLMQLSNDKNRGVIYRDKQAFDTAKFYIERSLKQSIELADTHWMAINYNSLGIFYLELKRFDNAILNFEKSLAFKKITNNTQGIVTTLTNIANCYGEMKNYQKAGEYVLEAEQLISPISGQKKINFLETKAVVFSKLKKYEIAYEALAEKVRLTDSMGIAENANLIMELETKYESETNKIIQEKLEAELLAAELQGKERTNQINRQRNYIIIGIAFTAILIILFVFIVKANLKRKIINRELLKKNQEIIQQSDMINAQKHQIEEKNQEIVDSINYAKRIQDAILPNSEFTKRILPENYIYYQPKDIVSGDFYWIEETKDFIFWAAADCTGHGVPGAMVSVVCHGALNRSILEFGLTDPGEILDKTRELVIQTFKKSGHQVKDGMDIALCVRKKGDQKVYFAGANNPLWIVRQGSSENNNEAFNANEHFLVEVKGDKQPIGIHFEEKPFLTHEIEVNRGDQLYLFTDGFADQFGGEKGKKFKYKNFKNIILQMAHSPLEFQAKLIESAFIEWKGNFEQLDDVCVVVVKV